jgi:hypothetical protein|eukprot:COSAG01_NODE_7801_length_3051_cov_2.077210_3_plen_94_part_00
MLWHAAGTAVRTAIYVRGTQASSVHCSAHCYWPSASAPGAGQSELGKKPPSQKARTCVKITSKICPMIHILYGFTVQLGGPRAQNSIPQSGQI